MKNGKKTMGIIVPTSLILLAMVVTKRPMERPVNVAPKIMFKKNHMKIVPDSLLRSEQ